MKITKSIDESRKIINSWKKEGKRIGFVPTMGALHKGHLSLVSEARKYADCIVMSIFVNRIQFNNKDDFDNYPVTFSEDSRKAQDAGVDLIFTPDEEILYDKHLTYIEVEQLTDELCGATRPGHFKGVFTVVAKFFNIVQPDIAVFGQKDIQQALSIQKMVNDLNFPVNIIIAPIVREGDGLALSSRNVHLSPDERKRALALYKSLQKADTMIKNGETDINTIINAMNQLISQEGNPDRIDYIEAVDASLLQSVDILGKKTVIALAVFFGSTRLIDNMIITRDEDGIQCVY